MCEELKQLLNNYARIRASEQERLHMYDMFHAEMFHSLDLEAQSWVQDDQQGGKQFPSRSSSQLFGQLHRVTDL